MTEKKYIILTDIKEFTYKNALLTNAQIEQMLQKFDQIVMESAKKYDISIVKSIGDAYLATSDSVENAESFSISILELTQKYDATHKISIKKINLRVALTYGDVTKNRSMNLDDYFGECINLAARIIDITPGGKIFVSEEFSEKLENTKVKIPLGEHEFHGILTKQTLYSLSDISALEIQGLSEKDTSLLVECDNIVFKSACVSAILSAQPLPFIEGFNIVGVHLYMIVKLSQKLETGVSVRVGGNIFKEMVTPIGAGYFISQGLNTLAKIALPGFGGFLFSPISFAITYAMGKIYTTYFFYQKAGEKFVEPEITDIFLKQKNIGRHLAKKEKLNILKTGKKFYKDVIGIKKKSGYSHVQKDLVSMLKSQK